MPIPISTAIAEQFAEPRLCRRRGLCAQQGAVAVGARLWQAAAGAEVARRRRRRRRRRGRPALADEEAVSSALRFAERRRLGPFAAAPPRDPRDREKALAAMIRAGHGFALARAIIELAPGAEIDPDAASRTRDGR